MLQVIAIVLNLKKINFDFEVSFETKNVYLLLLIVKNIA